jgi:hypothetical protein
LRPQANLRKRLADLGQEIPPRENQNPQILCAYPRSRSGGQFSRRRKLN